MGLFGESGLCLRLKIRSNRYCRRDIFLAKRLSRICLKRSVASELSRPRPKLSDPVRPVEADEALKNRKNNNKNETYEKFEKKKFKFFFVIYSWHQICVQGLYLMRINNPLELVSKVLNHLAAFLHVYAGAQHDRVRTTKKKRYTQNSFKIHF